jgi:stage II sporulation protein GA (sporulation sigma-E factor processing peptidase)
VEIYLDIVILENIVINYLILTVTARFSKNKASNLRLLLGSVLGTAYLVLMILLPDMKVYTTVFSKVLLSIGMVAATFSFGRLKIFLKTLALFYATTFLFAGAGFALMFFKKDWGIMRNGVIMSPASLLDTTWAELLLAVAVTLIILRIVWDAIQSRFLREKLLVKVSIAFDRKSIDVPALVDTGNSLHDPLSNMPVVVVEFAAIKDLLPDDIRSIFEQDTEDDLSRVTAAISCSDWFSRFRLIPFTSLGKENGMLIGFRPDYIEIGEADDRKDVHEVIVGIYNKALSRNEQYRALMNPELMTLQ